MFGDYEDPLFEDIETLTDNIYELCMTDLTAIESATAEPAVTLKQLNNDLKNVYHDLRDKVCTFLSDGDKYDPTDVETVRTKFSKTESQYRTKIKKGFGAEKGLWR